ncbi:MAG: lytic transglycosylase domain-containing protein [Sarcina sp.]
MIVGKKEVMMIDECECKKGVKKMKVIKILLILIAILMIIGIIGGIAFFYMRNTYLPNEYSNDIQKYSVEYNLNPNLVKAVIKAESSYNPMVVSNMGAYGLMQITRETGYYIAGNMGMGDFNQTMLYNPDINIQMGCWYLRNLINEFGDVNTALAAYNAGRGNVSNWLKNPEYSSNGKTLKEIPFKETSNYVKKINFYEKLYTNLY